MTRDPVLEEAWTDIERALDAANVALEPARATPVVRVAPLVKPADVAEAAAVARRVGWRGHHWALVAASLFFAAAVAYQLLGGAR